MGKYRVVELFTSINGEGPRAGQLAVFVRFQGCGLACTYCDTRWANQPDAAFVWMDEAEIYRRIRQTGVKNVTLTGGEPLGQAGILELLHLLAKDGALSVEVETNGSIPLAPFREVQPPPLFTVDYKLPGSGMEQAMCRENFARLTERDTVKFVAGRTDLPRIREVVEEFGLLGKCHIYLSPVYGEIEPRELVDFLLENRWNDVNVQLQLHKIIWAPDARGV